jgi:aspartate carbamoyltransferase catalytic subunit
MNWRPDWGKDWEHFSSLEKGLLGADFVMSLRVQKERHSFEDKEATADFMKNFQLKAEHFSKEMMFMHPGPVNWGVELHDELQSHPRSLILLQVKYGVDLRRALLSEFFEALPRVR